MNRKQISSTIRSHVANGIDTLDTSDSYGPSEAVIGDFIRTTQCSPLDYCKVLTKYSPEPSYNISLEDVREVGGTLNVLR